MSDAAVRFARAVGYVGAGTAEFVLDGRDFYFLELNGRIQVEHPVTEAVTGLDLVEEQLRIARGRAARPTRPRRSGHAVEVRLYAEDPRTLPAAGGADRAAAAARRRSASTPASRRATRSAPRYDPLIAKLIAHGPTRDEALDRLRAALAETEVDGRDDEPAVPALARRAPGAARGRDDDRVPRRASAALAPPAPAAARAVAQRRSASTFPLPPPAPPPDLADAGARARRRPASRRRSPRRCRGP